MRRSGLGRKLSENEEKKCGNKTEKQCFLGTGKEYNFNLFARACHHMAISLLELDRLTYNT